MLELRDEWKTVPNLKSSNLSRIDRPDVLEEIRRLLFQLEFRRGRHHPIGSAKLHLANGRERRIKYDLPTVHPNALEVAKLKVPHGVEESPLAVAQVLSFGWSSGFQSIPPGRPAVRSDAPICKGILMKYRTAPGVFD